MPYTCDSTPDESCLRGQEGTWEWPLEPPCLKGRDSQRQCADVSGKASSTGASCDAALRAHPRGSAGFVLRSAPFGAAQPCYHPCGCRLAERMPLPCIGHKCSPTSQRSAAPCEREVVRLVSLAISHSQLVQGCENCGRRCGRLRKMNRALDGKTQTNSSAKAKTQLCTCQNCNLSNVPDAAAARGAPHGANLGHHTMASLKLAERRARSSPPRSQNRERTARRKDGKIKPLRPASWELARRNNKAASLKRAEGRAASSPE